MNDRDYSLFWDRVKKLVKAHKITYAEFAKYIGISHNTFKGWISNNRIPDAYTTFDISTALGVTVEYLVTGTDGRASKNREKEAFERKTAAAEILKMALRIGKNARLIG